MRIESSSIAMTSSRNYTAETMQDTATITRRYAGESVVGANATVTSARISEFEAEGGTALFTTSAEGGITRTEQNVLEYQDTTTKQLGEKGAQQAQAAQLASMGSINTTESFLANWDYDPNALLRRLMELLDQLNGKKTTWRGIELPARQTTTAATSGFRISAAAATMRYQETIAMLNGGTGEIGEANAAVIRQAESAQNSRVNGYWTRQTVQSGFVAGEENTAFASKGTVVTSDGRTIDFNISLEMSRSFEAAYVSASREAVFTDPLVINMDTDTAAVSDVSFYFDLNCDGVEEELSSLEAGSGFLALDKNGDGSINDGSELFGARTGDGFGELAQYDSDGNGWIDEGDEVFSRLQVWVRCGESDAQLLSLAEANVGAIFLGSQNTQYSLADSSGDAAAIIRKTGLYLKESGTVGTVQHMDFRT